MFDPLLFLVVLGICTIGGISLANSVVNSSESRAVGAILGVLLAFLVMKFYIRLRYGSMYERNEEKEE